MYILLFILYYDIYSFERNESWVVLGCIICFSFLHDMYTSDHERRGTKHTYISVLHSCTFLPKSAGPLIEKLQARILAGAAGEFSSPELTLCADSYPMSVPPLCYRSGM